MEIESKLVVRKLDGLVERQMRPALREGYLFNPQQEAFSPES